MKKTFDEVKEIFINAMVVLNEYDPTDEETDILNDAVAERLYGSDYVRDEDE